MAFAFHRHTRLLCAAIAAGILSPLPVYGATDLSDVPLSSASTSTVKPNILFILDDSGSMNLKFMPDGLSSRENRIGMRNHKCNLVYYNPAVRYVIPKTSDGSDVNAGTQTSFTAAYSEGYWAYDGNASTTTNLSTSFRAHTDDGVSYSTDKDDAAQAAYYWDYLGSTTLVPLSGDCEKALNMNSNDDGTTDTTTTGYCVDDPAIAGTVADYRVTTTPPVCSTAGSKLLWKKVIVSSTSGDNGAGIGRADVNGDGLINASDLDERQNFANWYSYYRNRLKMMKSASGRAFVQLGDSYRIGFITINPNSPVSSDKFLTVADYDTSQKSDWFDRLYAQTSNGSTPLRLALSRAGRYFAGKTDSINSGMSGDPVQYSCQQNFSILTTDGYWNGSGGEKLDGSTDMDNQDGVISELDAYRPSGSKYYVSPRPIFDGSSQTYSLITATNAYQYDTSCTAPATQRKEVQWQSRTVQVQERTSSLQERTSSLQERTSSLQINTSTLQTRTSADSGVTWTGWSNTGSCTWDNTGSSRRQCQYLAWTGWSNIGSCTPDAQESNTSHGQTWGGPATQCQYTAWSGWSNIFATCDAQAQDTSGTWSVGTARECRYDPNPWSGWSNVASCDAVSKDGSDPYDVYTARECQYTAWTGWNNVGSCSAQAKDGSDPYTVETARECQTIYGAWTNTSGACTPSATLECQSVNVTGWTNVTSCTASGPDGSGREVLCQNVASTAGKRPQYKTTLTIKTYTGPNQTGSLLSTTTPTDPLWSYLESPATCYPDGLQPAFPSTTITTGTPAPSSRGFTCSGADLWPCESITSGGGGVSSTVSSISAASDTDGNCILTATTSAAHPFIVGHSVDITNVTSGYGGAVEIIEVPSTTTFKYYVVGLGSCVNPGDGSGTATLSGGSSNSLADVAQYYYKSDLRSSSLGNCTGALGASVQVCEDNVPSTGTGNEDDRANWQHMTTFTMGLGLTGTVTYSLTYQNDSTSNVVTWPAVNGQITGRLDFQDIRLGTANWPIPQADGPTALDDLWHAAVNGRGQYFSAGDPDSVINGLTSALSGINARVASAAAAATSNLEPVAGDNFAYTAKYVTQKWTGELEAREIDLASGSVGTTPIWSAAAKLDALTGSACDNRNIKLFRSGATSNLVDFKWNTAICVSGLPSGSVTTLSAAEQAHFTSGGTDTLGLVTDEIGLLSQYPVMGDGSGGTSNQRAAAAGANLVNYLRGQRGKEGFDSGPPATNTTGDADKLYRSRDGVLGDIISAQPVFVRSPFAEYTGGTDPGYSTYKENQTGRTPMVYVAANDGMLHAFYAGTSVADTNGGVEAWAFIPTMVLPNLYKLASENYANQHVFTVDGTPTAADVYDRNASADCASATPANPENCWKTILVSGLNKGGKGYYALDITNPASPKGLWEFKNGSSCLSVNATTKAPTSTAYSDCHLGYSYNNPIIAKLSDGRWAAFVTSGYNNDDGIGYLYVLDALTGQVIYRIDTGVGSAATPSGLNHLNGWVNNALFDNTVQRIYGGDLLGNIWRFDVNDNFGDAGREATLVAQVVDDSNQPQSITTKPELGEVTGDPFIYVGTGRYLGTTDTSNTQTQTVWAIKDPLTTTPVSSLRTALVERTITNVGSGITAYRTVTAANCAAPDGWYADLPDSGERVNIDMKLQLGTLIVPTNVPTANACSIGGYSWLNYFNSYNGCPVTTAGGKTGVKLVGATGTESLAVGINVVRLPNGKTVVIATTSGAEQITLEAPFDTPPPVGKRVSWREIVQ